jgi:hypothetical protein
MPVQQRVAVAGMQEGFNRRAVACAARVIVSCHASIMAQGWTGTD